MTKAKQRIHIRTSAINCVICSKSFKFDKDKRLANRMLKIHLKNNHNMTVDNILIDSKETNKNNKEFLQKSTSKNIIGRKNLLSSDLN